MLQLQYLHGLGNIVSLGRLEIKIKYYNDKFQLKCAAYSINICAGKYVCVIKKKTTNLRKNAVKCLT